ncbi:hypothetical protein PRIPAC_85594, partial [Pristionchus pacificus]|uniref:Uncharacterized protein n=1 Tax=Pristionchus pacificus TaxID=54126 RepID=A0A2A6CCD6_PRIPA
MGCERHPCSSSSHSSLPPPPLPLTRPSNEASPFAWRSKWFVIGDLLSMRWDVSDIPAPLPPTLPSPLPLTRPSNEASPFAWRSKWFVIGEQQQSMMRLALSSLRAFPLPRPSDEEMTEEQRRKRDDFRSSPHRRDEEGGRHEERTTPTLKSSE